MKPADVRQAGIGHGAAEGHEVRGTARAVSLHEIGALDPRRRPASPSRLTQRHVDDGVGTAYGQRKVGQSYVGELETRVGEIMTAKRAANSVVASKNITKRIEELGDWRGEMLARIRQLIHDADPEIEEEWKWAKASSSGTPVWSHDGIVCTGESYKQVVKLTFARGASLPDPRKLFNSSLEGNTRRAIDIREGEKVNDAAFKALIRAAVAANAAARARS
jgi:hypothetical protein